MTKLDDSFFNKLLQQASESPRKRSHFNLHKDLNEPVQRLCIGLQKGTYVQPHHHPQDYKWELLLVLRGSVVLLVFDRSGVVLKRLVLGQQDALTGMEMPPDTWHTLFPVSDDAVVMEVKQGPYIPTAPDDFAAWAPAEGHADVVKFQQWLENAAPGDRYSA